MKNNPDIKINFLAPAASYNDGQQQVLRAAAVTGNLPEVYFLRLHMTAELVHTLLPRHQITDRVRSLQLKAPGLSRQELFSQDGGSRSDRRQAVRPAGQRLLADHVYQCRSGEECCGDPDHMPTTFPELIALAKKIHALDPKIAGMGYESTAGRMTGSGSRSSSNRAASWLMRPARRCLRQRDRPECAEDARQFVTEGGQKPARLGPVPPAVRRRPHRLHLLDPAHVQTI